ncbi:NAD-dependent deacylase [Flavobacteriaceae bacterium]|jgi:NAD-dependent deacetylase|nr:NAD-dependent deacylase [Flavobacteriaceae bacterium]
MKNIVVLTGAGMSAESGIKTFRDAGGLWEGFEIEEVATPEAFEKNPKLVFDFYNQRRKQLFDVEPNKAHHYLKDLENYYNVTIITQNVDDLHERAKSSHVIHLHGELRKVRSTKDETFVLHWETDLHLGDIDTKGNQLRPHIVWFGEPVPMLDKAIKIVEEADILVIIGTSMKVYPAASLINFIKFETPIYFIDPKPTVSKNNYKNLTLIKNGAVKGTKELLKKLVY